MTGLKYPASKVMHEEANDFVEKLSEIICFIMIKLGVPTFILPKVIYSFFVYFTTDAGGDAFELPYPVW